MKKLLLIPLMSVFLLTGCGEKKQEPVSKSTKPDTASAMGTTADPNAPQNTSLRYALKKGDKLTFRASSFSTNTQIVQADSSMKQFQKEDKIMMFDVEVKDIDPDGNLELKTTISSVKIDVDANGRKLSYTSGTKLDTIQKMNFMQYEAIVKNPFSFRMTPKGDILEMFYVDRIVNKFIELKGIKSKINPAEKQQFQASVIEGALKPLVQQIFRLLPEKSVGKDSVWSNSTPGRLGVFQVENKATYKMTGFEKNESARFAVFDAGLDVISKGKNKFSEGGVDYDFAKPAVQASGKIYFNMTRGCVQKSKTSVKLTMSMSMQRKAGPKGPQKVSSKEIVENMNLIELL